MQSQNKTLAAIFSWVVSKLDCIYTEVLIESGYDGFTLFLSGDSMTMLTSLLLLSAAFALGDASKSLLFLTRSVYFL